MSMLEATTSLRKVQMVLGNDAYALLGFYVRDGETAAYIARRRREREDCTLGRIKAALTRLAEHWGM